MGRGLTGSAVGVGIPGFFMKHQRAFRGKQLDKPWGFTVGWGGKRMVMCWCDWRKGNNYTMLHLSVVLLERLCGKEKGTTSACFKSKITQHCHWLEAHCNYNVRRPLQKAIQQSRWHIPFKVVDFVCILSSLIVFFIGLILEYLNSFTSPRLIFTCFSHREQLSHLIL